MTTLNKNYDKIEGTDSASTIDDTNSTQIDQIEVDMGTIETDLTTAQGSVTTLNSRVDQSVVSGATPTFTNTNFTEATDKNYVTDAEAIVIGNTSNTNTGDQTISDATSALVYATSGQTIDYRIYQSSSATRAIFVGSNEAYMDIHLVSL